MQYVASNIVHLSIVDHGHKVLKFSALQQRDYCLLAYTSPLFKDKGPMQCCQKPCLYGTAQATVEVQVF